MPAYAYRGTLLPAKLQTLTVFLNGAQRRAKPLAVRMNCSICAYKFIIENAFAQSELRPEQIGYIASSNTACGQTISGSLNEYQE